jgi:geranylgeranyl transferase type-2 subunit beta
MNVSGHILTLLMVAAVSTSSHANEPTTSSPDILKALREFIKRTALSDGSFRPGVDPNYAGMSDSAYSDLAPVAYAIVIHRTFGWELPHEEKTRAWLLARQQEDGAFVNVKGTADPKSAQGRIYNTTMALMALHGLSAKPKRDPIPVFDQVLLKDYKELPAYSSSFFPLAYTLSGKPLSDQQNQRLRATMIQAEDGYLNDHIAATFHAAHYDRLLGAKTPKADKIAERALRDQKPDGSWMLNPLARDRHATFDAVFTLKHLGGGSDECRKAIARAADWALTCRNSDGGFGHFPGSTSDWDAVFFHVGTLVMSGRLNPTDKLPKDAHLLGWGHLFP